MNIFIIIIIAVLAMGGIGYAVISSNNSAEVAQEQPTGSVNIDGTVTTPLGTTTTTTTTIVEINKSVTVNYQSNSFSLLTAEINVGDTVRFVNNSEATIRIASDPHPSHTSYPALNSGDLKAGSSYSISFPNAVTVNYHNHYQPAAKGTIIVK